MYETWLQFAYWKDQTGLRTDVVMIEDVLGKSFDDAVALKAYIAQMHSEGVMLMCHLENFDIQPSSTP